RWTHENWESDALRACDRLFNRSGHDPGRLRNLQIFQELVELLAIFCKVDRFRRGADDFHAGLLQGKREIQRSLPAELHDHSDVRSFRSLMLINCPDV